LLPHVAVAVADAPPEPFVGRVESGQGFGDDPGAATPQVGASDATALCIGPVPVADFVDQPYEFVDVYSWDELADGQTPRTVYVAAVVDDRVVEVKEEGAW
jgi:hypothetical protein